MSGFVRGEVLGPTHRPDEGPADDGSPPMTPAQSKAARREAKSARKQAKAERRAAKTHGERGQEHAEPAQAAPRKRRSSTAEEPPNKKRA